MLIPHQKHPQSGILLHSCISEYSSSTLLSGQQPLPFPENDRVHNFIRVKLGDRPLQEEFVVRTAPSKHTLSAQLAVTRNSFTLADAETTWSLVHLFCTAFLPKKMSSKRRKCVCGCERCRSLFSLPKEEPARQKWLEFIFGGKRQSSSISQRTVW